MKALEAACETADESVEHGMCMSSEVADMLHPACFEAGATLLGVTAEQRTKIKDTMTEVHTACKAAETQVCSWKHDLAARIHRFWISAVGRYSFIPWKLFLEQLPALFQRIPGSVAIYHVCRPPVNW